MNKKQKNFSNLLVLIATVMCFSANVNAQVTIGSLEEPTPGAVLDLSKVSTRDLGLLLPQVSLTNLSTWAPLSGSHVNGMFVYNTNASTGTGIYYWKDGSWVVLATATASADSWSVTGNAGTNSATSFIGTTDDVPLVFKVNNTLVGYSGHDIEPDRVLDNEVDNVSFGWNALQAPQGFNNTAFGGGALHGSINGQQSTGKENTAVGARALQWCASGTNNTAVGFHTLLWNSGYKNTAVGSSALENNGGSSNVAIGASALEHSKTSESSIAIGVDALKTHWKSGNTAIGYQAAMGLDIYQYPEGSSGEMLVAMGYNALRANSEGSQNTAVGFNSLIGNTEGHLNTAIGSQTMLNNTGGDYNTAVGALSLVENTGGEYNTAIGVQTMNKNETGSSNTGLGSGALHSNTTAHWNTAVGTSALWHNETGEQNTAVGGEALAGNFHGSYNTAVGTRALWSTINVPDGNGGANANPFGHASNNTAVGYEALVAVTTGGSNTAMGLKVMSKNTEGHSNTAVGFDAMGSNITGNYNTAIGFQANIGGESLTNSTAIGAGAFTEKSYQVVAGGVDVTSIGGFANWTRVSDKWGKLNVAQNVPGLLFINKLKPITYKIDPGPEDDLWIKNLDSHPIVYSGFEMSDVEAAAAEADYNFSGIDAETGLRYSDFVVPLVQAVKDLSAENANLQRQIDELNEKINLILSGQ